MDDAGAGDPADTRQAAVAMMQERIDQRSVEIARGRVDDQPGGFVDNDQMIVLMDNGEGDVLRLVMRRYGVRYGDRADRAWRGARAGSRATTSVTVTPPAAISRLIRSRERVGAAAASARSSRHPAASGGITALRIDTPVAID